MSLVLDVVGVDALSSLIRSLEDNVESLVIPRKTPPRPRILKNKKDGLDFFDYEELHSEGECTGGKYYYITDVREACSLLEYWTAKKCWAAIDLETGPARRTVGLPSGSTAEFRYAEIVDPFTCPIFLCSVSVEPGVAVVFDIRILRQDDCFVQSFKQFLLECHLVAHASLFEQSFLFAQFGVLANIVYDTLIVHQIISAGLTDGSGLKDIAKKYLGLELEKTWQKSFAKMHPESPLQNSAIAYSAGDVCFLLELARLVDKDLDTNNLRPVWEELERPLMKWICKAKMRGVRIDFDKVSKIETEARALLAEKEAVYSNLCSVNYKSPVQLMKWFDEHGVKLLSTDEKNFLKVIERYSGIVRDVAKAVLDCRGEAKILSTYIEPLLYELPSPVTGRIHPEWQQTPTDTGRFSCNTPNMQNWPSKGVYANLRNAVIADEGHKLVICDFSQFEVRALADMADEPMMISVFEQGFKARQDLHEYCERHGLPDRIEDWMKDHSEEYKAICEEHPDVPVLLETLLENDFHAKTASFIYKVPLDSVTTEQRKIAKNTNFAVPYGAGPPRLVETAGITLAEAKQILESYYSAYPKVKQYLERCRIQAKEGYTSTPFGRKRFYQYQSEIDLAASLHKLKNDPARAKQWAKKVDQWGTSDPNKMAPKMFRFNLSEIERQGTNHPIQAINADATKLSTIIAGPLLEALHPECCIILWVHDEIVVTAPVGVVDQVVEILEQSMIAAAKRFLKKVPIEVGVTVCHYWKK